MQTNTVNGAATTTAAAQTGKPEDIKQAAAPAVDGQSTIASAKEPAERGFFGSVVDKVVSVFSWIKGKIVAFFSYIFCCSTDDTKATQITQLTEKKAFVDNIHADFIKAREEGTLTGSWPAKFPTLSQDLQDLIVKEDLAKLAREKGNPEAQITEIVEKAFQDEAQRNVRLSFVRDLVEFNYKDVIPVETYSAAEDRYLPSYLKHISSNIAKQISALQETAE